MKITIFVKEQEGTTKEMVKEVLEKWSRENLKEWLGDHFQNRDVKVIVEYE